MASSSPGRQNCTAPAQSSPTGVASNDIGSGAGAFCCAAHLSRTDFLSGSSPSSQVPISYSSSLIGSRSDSGVLSGSAL